MQCVSIALQHALIVATPLWAKCEIEIHTPKKRNLESSEIFENS